MRALVQTMLIRDRKGYEVRDYGDPEPGGTLLSGKSSGIHVVGKSGVNEKSWISIEANHHLWDRVRSLNSPSGLAEFMCRWGQLSRWLGDEGDQPYEEPYILIEPHLNSIKYLARFVDADDRVGFCQSLKKQVLLSRANIAIDTADADLPLIIEAPSLLRFMLFEMWSQFGGERPGRTGVRSCAHCGRTFRVGGRRGTKARRVDARFCSDSCKNMASRTRRANWNSVPTQQR